MVDAPPDDAEAERKRATHHVDYESPLPDRRILSTRISHPLDRTDYGPSIWSQEVRAMMRAEATARMTSFYTIGR
jgi:hypothetical protein